MTVNQLDANSQKLHGVLESLGPCSSVSAALGQGLGFLYPRVHVVSLNHRLTYWRAGASQPSRSTGTIFHYIYIFLVCRVVFHAFTILRTTRCTVNRSNFTYSVSRACANIYTIFYAFVCSRVICTTAGRFACRLVVGLRFTAVLCAICFQCRCCTLVGSLPLTNNGHHSASIYASPIFLVPQFQYTSLLSFFMQFICAFN